MSGFVMNALDTLAERRIGEAQQRGEFHLPGAGRPLNLDEDQLVPEELRVAYRMLKNAGFVPPELEANCEIREIERLLEVAEAGKRSRLLSRLNFLLSRASARHRNLRVEQDYLEKVSARLEARRRKANTASRQR